MTHDVDVVLVVSSDVFQSVSELLAAGEELLESAETARQGVASSIDNFRVGQHEPNQTDMPEIVWHFIDEVGLI